MIQRVFLKFRALLKKRMGTLNLFLISLGLGVLMGVLLPVNQHRQREKEKVEDSLQRFQEEARERFAHIKNALVDVQEDLRAREDICDAPLAEDKKTQDLLSLKIEKYNQHLISFLDNVANSNRFFGNAAYAQMRKFMQTYDTDNEQFRSCLPSSLQTLNEQNWARQGGVMLNLLEQRLMTIEQIQTGEDLKHYQNRMLAEKAEQTTQQGENNR